ncbi:glycosyltransferase family 9 protein [Pseudanabaena sp. PCC 6802]|uniref:glycosyltransferase family 9 protein n=1 Tax=Pseudanabaena sp. PCC 6802 TaxID=118173 RepID=UPI0004776D49
MRVLALVPGGIGDQILFFPTLDSLKQQYPQASIDVIVEPRSAGAYRVCTSVNKIWQFDFKDMNSLADWGNLLGNIRDREYDAVISLGKGFSVDFFLWLTGIPKRISYASAGNMFLSQPVSLNERQYVAVTYHDLLKGLDINTDCPPIQIKVPKSDLDWAAKEQQNLGIQGSGYILLHPGVSAFAKSRGTDIYPVDNWVAIAQAIQTKLPGIPILLLQEPGNRDVTTQIAAKLPQALAISPPDIGKLAATIAAANLLLCTDSTPMHLAVAVGTNLVALFSTTEPERLLPQDKRFMSVKAPAGNPLSAIAPQEVLAKIFP